jgi:murein DD-endopeptidase MepM/ murein hydrolase activator NlpD
MKQFDTHFILRFFLFVLISGLAQSCNETTKAQPPSPSVRPVALSDHDSLALLFKEHTGYIAQGFDFPVGKPNGKGYYNAQPFGKNNHLGDDWNGTGGGNSDKGDPIFSIANGYVSQSINFYGGWGKVVRIVHAIPQGDSLELVESLYAHMDAMQVKKGQWIHKGDTIGTIGTAEGIYLAHLHLEVREQPAMYLGGGYSEQTQGYLDPTKFIRAHRKINQ